MFKEFLTSLSREVFDTNRGLWLATKQQELYPNSHSYAKERMYIAIFVIIADIHRACSPSTQLVSLHWSSTRKGTL